MARIVGKVKWFGGYDLQRQRDNNFGFIDLLNGSEAFVHKSALFCEPVTLDEHVPVTFELESPSFNNQRKNPSAIKVQLLSKEHDISTLKDCLAINDGRIFIVALNRLQQLCAEAEYRALIRDKVLQSPKPLPSEIEGVLPTEVLMRADMADVRQVLTTRRRIIIYHALPEPNLFVDEIQNFDQTLRETDSRALWEGLSHKFTRGDALYGICPDEIKARILHQIYQQHFAQWDEWYPEFTANNLVAATQVYGANLVKQDWALAACWAKKETPAKANEKSHFHLEKMISARAAEKAAALYYRSLSYEVLDISITQPVDERNHYQRRDATNSEWLTHDLKLSNGKLIDVKNARPPLNRDDRYVEHQAKLKERPDIGKQVTVTGVLSPYLKLESIKSPSASDRDVIILGECTIDSLTSLAQRYSKGSIRIELLPDEINTFTQRRKAKCYIPPWAFHYPVECYKNSEDLKGQWQIMIEHLPTPKEMRLLHRDPRKLIPALLMASAPLPKSWTDEVSKPIYELYEQLRQINDLTTGDLFLALLNHFVHQLQHSDQEFKPEDYKMLLFADDETRPAGLMDPLKVIHEWCVTLCILWEGRDVCKMNEYKSFRFQGTGMLRGSRTGQRQYEDTILAYCGGFIEDWGKCGNSPLILGLNELCPECHRLICKKCGFCSSDESEYGNAKPCSLCGTRMKEKKVGRSKKANWSMTEQEPPEFIDEDLHRLQEEYESYLDSKGEMW